MRMRFWRTILVVAPLLLLVAAMAAAQEITGTITGTVKDSSGAVIPGVSVAVRNMGTNAMTMTVSDENGAYMAQRLPIGSYEVTAELQGFKRFLRANLELHVAERVRIDVVLQAGDLKETVEVTGAAPIVETESSEVSTLINNRQVLQMPLNGRNVISLVAMQPGVSSTLPSTLFVGLASLQSVFVNGNRASQNNWMIDGADNNDAGSNLALINYVNVDAVGEVKILRSNYNAEFGRSGGGQINVVTKSGTNLFKGSAYEFYRSDKFDAINFFSTIDYNGDGKRDPAPLKYHNFGATLGGPVMKDKLFFFWGEEFRRITSVRGGGVQITRVPTAKQRAGDFSEFPTIIIRDPTTGQPFPGNVIPSARIDSLAKGLLGRFPMPNADPTVLGGNRNFSVGTPQIRNFREELVRVDYRLSNSHQVYARFINDAIPSEEPFGEVFGTFNAAFPGIANTKTDNPGRSFVGTWNWVVNAKMLNEFSFNYSRGAIFSTITGNAQRDVSIPKVFSGAPGDDLLPGIAFGGSGGYGGWNFFGPYDNTYGSYRIKDTITKNNGNHALKAGILMSWEFKNENAAGGTNGAFTFPGTSSSAFTSSGDAFADFLLGRASAYSETNVDITSHLRYQMYEAFVQDDWKVRSNLTLNLGLRWSYILPPYDTNNVLNNFDPSTWTAAKAYAIGADNLRVTGTGKGDPLNGIIVAGKNSPYGNYVTAKDATSFGPRLGFSWDVFRDGKTAVRGGYGQYFDRTLVGIALQNAFVNPPFVYSAVFNAAGAAGNPTLANPAAGAARNNEALVVNLNAMSPNFKVPTTHQYSIGMQRQLLWGFTIDAAYVGSQGRNLLWAMDINQTPAGTLSPTNAGRPYTGFGNIMMRSTEATSSYNSLQASLMRRWSKGLQLTVNYTLSKAVTDSSSDRSDFVQDINNKSAERAVASYDRTHIFSMQYVYELPFFNDPSNKLLYNTVGGWQISGTTRYASGLPLTMAQAANTSNSFGNVSRRPDLIGDPNGPKTIEQWFNTAAFANPAANTFGNSPRSVVRGPHQHLTDIGLFKNFAVHQRIGLQFRWEIFNAFNETNFSAVGTTFPSATFGRVTSAAEPRLMQFGLKLTF